MPKPSNHSFKPGKMVGGFRAIDAKGQLRTLPANPAKMKKFLEGIERKVAKQKELKPRKISVPKVLSAHTLVRVLTGLGFKQKGEGSQWIHPSYGRIIVPIGSQATNIDIHRHPQIRKAVTDWLKLGHKL